MEHGHEESGMKHVRAPCRGQVERLRNLAASQGLRVA